MDCQKYGLGQFKSEELHKSTATDSQKKEEKRNENKTKHIIMNLALNDKIGTNLKHFSFRNLPVLLNHVKASVCLPRYSLYFMQISNVSGLLAANICQKLIDR